MTGLPFRETPVGQRLSAPSICPIAEGVIKYRGALGKPEIGIGEMDVRYAG